MELNNTKQCWSCPWRVASQLEDIPNYDPSLHEELQNTIANEGIYDTGPLHLMACHYSTEDNDMECIGWLHNQLGVGNNIALRLRMRNCKNAKGIEVLGEQHKRFEDTFKQEMGGAQ